LELYDDKILRLHGWSIALDPVEECAATRLQQSAMKMLAMAIHDQDLMGERT
jgi:hypothetical protein